MNRKEVWESIIDALEDRFTRGEFEPGEYEVAVNRAVGTISIIHRPTRSVFALTDTTCTHYDSEDRLVTDTHSCITGKPFDFSYRQ